MVERTPQFTAEWSFAAPLPPVGQDAVCCQNFRNVVEPVTAMSARLG